MFKHRRKTSFLELFVIFQDAMEVMEMRPTKENLFLAKMINHFHKDISEHSSCFRIFNAWYLALSFFIKLRVFSSSCQDTCQQSNFSFVSTNIDVNMNHLTKLITRHFAPFKFIELLMHTFAQIKKKSDCIQAHRAFQTDEFSVRQRCFMCMLIDLPSLLAVPFTSNGGYMWELKRIAAVDMRTHELLR